MYPETHFVFSWCHQGLLFFNPWLKSSTLHLFLLKTLFHLKMSHYRSKMGFKCYFMLTLSSLLLPYLVFYSPFVLILNYLVFLNWCELISSSTKSMLFLFECNICKMSDLSIFVVTEENEWATHGRSETEQPREWIRRWWINLSQPQRYDFSSPSIITQLSRANQELTGPWSV